MSDTIYLTVAKIPALNGDTSFITSHHSVPKCIPFGLILIQQLQDGSHVVAFFVSSTPNKSIAVSPGTLIADSRPILRTFHSLHLMS